MTRAIEIAEILLALSAPFAEACVAALRDAPHGGIAR